MADNHKTSGAKSMPNPAADLVRSKINAIYSEEPSAKAEEAELEHIHHKLSKHQQFMQELADSGKSQEDIQTEWHAYYQELSDDEKREVWQEFYQASEQERKNADITPEPEHPPTSTHVYHEEEKPEDARAKKKSVADVRDTITKRALGKNKRRLSAKSHFKSLLFGISMGALTLLILLFSFFNERFIAPFITPSRNVSSTPIVIDPSSTAVGPESLIVIPKINIEIPVIYNINTIDEKTIQTNLENGVVHYATTPDPGEKGNVVLVGHSSSNIFNNGKYKFAFVLLHRLEVGDTFMLTKDGTRYVYKIYDKKIVKPTDVSVLGPSDRASTVTLITCDPPGSSINRLIIIGEQISPDPAKNTQSTVTASTQPTIVPGNAPSLWSRLTGWL